MFSLTILAGFPFILVLNKIYVFRGDVIFAKALPKFLLAFIIAFAINQFMLIFFEHIFPIVKRMVDTTEYNYSPLTDYKIDGSHGIEETNELSHSMSGTDSANDTDNSTTGSSASL